jgi:LPS sulfotransferase NodH
MNERLSLRGLKSYVDHVLHLARYRLLRPSLSATRFVIFGRGRSGTTALVSLLNAHPLMLCEGEILSRPVFRPLEHVLAHCANSAAPVYGCKILSYQLSEVQPLQQRTAFVSQLYDHGFRIIYLRRRNLLRHALSNLRAREFGFHARTSESVTSAPIVVDPQALMHWLHGSASLAAFEAESLQTTPYLSLTYEDHLADESQHQVTVAAICDFLGLAPAVVTSSYRKISPVALREAIANYEQVAQALLGTPYAVFLDQD